MYGTPVSGAQHLIFMLYLCINVGSGLNENYVRKMRTRGLVVLDFFVHDDAMLCTLCLSAKHLGFRVVIEFETLYM